MPTPPIPIMMSLHSFSLMNIMNPLINAPSIILQLIVIYAMSVVSAINLFNGEKIGPRVTVKAGGKTFSFLFKTGALFTQVFQINYLER
jgi:hypothetical protein